jgi:hypothetical protein
MSSPTVPDRLIDRKTVAFMFSIHPKSVDDFVEKGRIPPRAEGWEGEPRWIESECVARIRAMRKAEKAEQV